MAKVLGFNHVSILVKNAEISLQFYKRILGLTIVKRPDLEFAGYWLDIGAGQTIHLMELDNPYQKTIKPSHGGRDMHFALQVDSVAEYIEILKVAGIKYSISKSGRKAIFLWDIDNNVIELFEFNHYIEKIRDL